MKRVLIVDDETGIRDMLRCFFEMDEFLFFEAGSGREAIELIKREKFDCIVSDVRMPDGDGIELAKNISSLSGPKPKLVLMTGLDKTTDVELETLGVFKIVLKPFLPDNLLCIVKEALATV